MNKRYLSNIDAAPSLPSSCHEGGEGMGRMSRLVGDGVGGGEAAINTSHCENNIHELEKGALSPVFRVSVF